MALFQMTAWDMSTEAYEGRIKDTFNASNALAGERLAGTWGTTDEECRLHCDIIRAVGFHPPVETSVVDRQSDCRPAVVVPCVPGGLI